MLKNIKYVDGLADEKLYYSSEEKYISTAIYRLAHGEVRGDASFTD